MKRIVTAIGNTRLNEILKQKQKYEIVAKDIQYKEGILEILSIEQKIDILIISEILEGAIDFKELINKIIQTNEGIEIIVFLDRENTELRSFLYSKGISKIYLNNEIDIDTFIINLEDNVQEKTNELNAEIRKLKEIIKKQETKKQEKKRGKVIAVTGAYGSGKSIVACLISKDCIKKDKKTIIIDFDVYNSSINIIYQVPKYKSNCNNLKMEEQIVEISKNEHILCAIDLIFSDKNSERYINFEEIMEYFLEEYDYIIIDTTSNSQYKYQKRILNLADDIIFIVVPTIIEIKKANSIYEVFIMDLKIDKEKIKIIINKETPYSIDDSIVSKIFNVKQIKEKIKYIEGIEMKLNNQKIKSNLKIDSLM